GLVDIQGVLHEEVGVGLPGLGDAGRRGLIFVAPDAGVADLFVVVKTHFGAGVEAVAEPGGKLKFRIGVADDAAVRRIDLVEVCNGHIVVCEGGDVVGAEAPAGGVGGYGGVLRAFDGDDGQHARCFVESVDAAAGVIVLGGIQQDVLAEGEAAFVGLRVDTQAWAVVLVADEYALVVIVIAGDKIGGAGAAAG